MSAMMKAIRFEKTGGTDVLEVKDIPIPTPGAGEILVKNEYAGVNFIDTYFRSGLYPSESFPRGLGSEGAGVVNSVGEGVTKHRKGDKVVYLSGNAYAE